MATRFPAASRKDLIVISMNDTVISFDEPFDLISIDVSKYELAPDVTGLCCGLCRMRGIPEAGHFSRMVGQANRRRKFGEVATSTFFKHSFRIPNE